MGREKRPVCDCGEKRSVLETLAQSSQRLANEKLQPLFYIKTYARWDS